MRTISFLVVSFSDPELTCMFCNLGKCDCEIQLFGPGQRITHGAHQSCIEHHEVRMKNHIERMNQLIISDVIDS